MSTTPRRAHRTIVWALFALYLVPAVLELILGWRIPSLRSVAEWTLLAWGGFPLVGALILSSRPQNLIGRLMLAIGLWQSLFDPIHSPVVARALPAGVETVVLSFQTVSYCTLILIALVFPSGHLQSRLSRVVFTLLVTGFAIVAIAQFVVPGPLSITGRPNPFGLPVIGSVAAWVLTYNYLAVPVLLVGTVVEISVRWVRTADRVVRLQLGWFAFGIVVTVIITALSAGGGGTNDDWLSTVSTLAINAIPVGIFVAITKYGLYSIGRIVSRTVSYVVVTAVAVGVYAGIVVLSSAIFQSGNPFVVAVATLVAAAVFLPLLRVVQRSLDRRFDRRRYDAERIVEAFGERLRNAVDPESTIPDLVVGVERSLQPVSLGIWSRGEIR